MYTELHKNSFVSIEMTARSVTQNKRTEKLKKKPTKKQNKQFMFLLYIYSTIPLAEYGTCTVDVEGVGWVSAQGEGNGLLNLE